MNKTVLRLPRRRRVSPSYRKPRRRVFYLGYRCIGPMFCQDIQRVYLKRHRDDEWSFLHYEEGYSFEFEHFKGPELLERLSLLRLEDEISMEQLRATGWRDPLDYDVIQLSDYQ